MARGCGSSYGATSQFTLPLSDKGLSHWLSCWFEITQWGSIDFPAAVRSWNSITAVLQLPMESLWHNFGYSSCMIRQNPTSFVSFRMMGENQTAWEENDWHMFNVDLWFFKFIFWQCSCTSVTVNIEWMCFEAQVKWDCFKKLTWIDWAYLDN